MDIPCPDCRGSRYGKEAEAVFYPAPDGKGYSLPQLMAMDVRRAMDVCAGMKLVRGRLQVLDSLGLGYLTLGEQTPSFRAARAQRLKLASEMGRPQSDAVFIFDEPTISLHPLDVRTLLAVFETLIRSGATVIVIEHDLDLSAMPTISSIWAPAAGRRRADCRRRYAPEEVQAAKESVTGRFL